MATEPLFQDDAYLQEAEAQVKGVMEITLKDRPARAVLLDRTPFYAAGGGQPGDVGALSWEGGSAEVATTVKGDAFERPGEILHVLAEGAATPAEGASVRAAIDWTHRYGCMRIHTALHLLSVVAPFPVTGGQIGPEKGRLDFDMPEAPEDKEAIEAKLNALIEADHPVSSEWVADAELDARPELVKTMAVKPPRGSGRVRLVRIGAGETPVDLQPCGGTHVRTVGEIGLVRIGKIEKKGKQNRRISLSLS